MLDRTPRKAPSGLAASRAAAVCLAVTLAACAAPREDVPRPFSEAWPHPAETMLARELGKQLAAHPGQSGIYPLVSGMEAFSIRAGLAESAERTLDLQYFIVHEDTTTQLLLYRVLLAADRGVRVRLLIDDLDSLGKDYLAAYSAHSNIEVRLFNPFSARGALGLSHFLEYLGDSDRLNRRMHNKLWIADNAAAIVGGRNLGDEYFDAHGEVNFADFDVLAVGPVVPEISRSFDEYWNSEWAVPIEAFAAAPSEADQLAKLTQTLEARVEGFRDNDYARALRDTRLGSQLRSGQLPLTPASAIALYDKPAKISGESGSASPSQIFSSHVRPLIEGARRENILISPYFIPSEQGLGILGALARRGVRVRISTNSLASADYWPLAYAGYARLRARLLAVGLELHEMRPEADGAVRIRRPGSSSGAYLHTKAIVVDREHVIVGSINLDPRSRLLNTEVALLLESPALGARLGSLFEEAVRPAHAFHVVLAVPGEEQTKFVWITEEDGKETRYDHEPLTGFWRRLLAKVLGVFAPNDLL